MGGKIGGYDDSAFAEGDSVRFLTGALQMYKEIYCHFKSEDKTPNFDGYFELVQRNPGKHDPYARFEVQIKSLTRDYHNCNKRSNVSAYKYSCDTNAINAAKQLITLNPVILFFVDHQNKLIFYKYCSIGWLSEIPEKTLNQKSITIYFNESDKLKDVKDFVSKCSNIYKAIKWRIEDNQSIDICDSEDLSTKTFELNIEKWSSAKPEVISSINGAWQHIKYFDNDAINDDVGLLPEDKGGIFALVIAPNIIKSINQYIIYIDGVQSIKTGGLRKKCLSLGVDNRRELSHMRNQWREYIYLYYLVIENDSLINDLKAELVRILNPPCNTEIPKASVFVSDKARRAW